MDTTGQVGEGRGTMAQMLGSKDEPGVPHLGDLVVRELAPTELPRLLRFQPFASLGKPPNSATSRVVVMEDPKTGEILGFGVTFVTLHIDPIWLDSRLRKKGGPLRKLWHGIWAMMKKYNWSTAYSVIADQDIPGGNLSFANRGGFVKIPGSLYYVTSDNAPDLGRVVRLASEQPELVAS
jgi:hypothetical protein